MKYFVKILFHTSLLLVAAIILIKLIGCLGIKSKAPKGIHGEFTLESSTSEYIANGLTKDSVLEILMQENLRVKNGRLNDYDAPFDSLRYLIGEIRCGNNEQIEAYIEFKDKTSKNTSFKIIWFNANPTKNDSEYDLRTKEYYDCFETLMKRCKIIK